MAPQKKTCATNNKTTPSFTILQEEPAQASAAAQASEAVTSVAPPIVAAEASVATTNTETINLTSGRVKWFNNKAGYGFITVNDCETNEERDMFVHHSEIKVEQSQYKYLVQGEYVEFVIGAISRDDKIDTHATNVRGINGGKLMCETRNEVRSFRSTQEPTERPQSARPARQQETTVRPARQQESSGRQESSARPARQQESSGRQESSTRRPRLAEADQTEWMVVPRRRTETVATRPKSHPRQRQPEIEIA
jgi:cold shock CspA family protein